MPTLSKMSIPNGLTIVRLLFALAFIVVLSIYRFPDANEWALPAATGLFVVAALTDALDGYLARKWDAISVFGRIMDPFADKLLVLGAFIMLAGPNFVAPQHMPEIGGRQTTGVLPWMAIIILARELLVTTLRGVYESRGVDFSATLSGKLKMMLQSVCVPAVLMVLWLLVADSEAGRSALFVTVNFWLAIVVTVVTVASGVPYVARAVRANGEARESRS